jgi:hypothetical protein
VKIIAIGRDEMDVIKTLWEGLNAHHLLQSTHFKKHFLEFTFEQNVGVPGLWGGTGKEKGRVISETRPRPSIVKHYVITLH